VTARQLIDKAYQQLPDATIRQQIIELIETIVVYKFPSLTREEIETMLGLSELKKTKVYQEAREEGRQEGQQEGQLRTKLAMIPKLQQRGLSIEEMADLLELDAETIRQRIQ
jgi:predicted transposase/invertase (TIGR01784 family)